MEDYKFQVYRDAFLKLMFDKTLAEVRASRMTFSTLMEMDKEQVEILIQDMERLEAYKTRVHSAHEEWERIQEGFYRS